MAKTPQNIEVVAQVFRILSDPTRLRILNLLQQEEHNVTSLCQKLQMPQPTISRHLSIMRMAGIVNNRREGKQIHYSIADLKRSESARAIQTFTDKATAVRMGPIVVGLAKE